MTSVGVTPFTIPTCWYYVNKVAVCCHAERRCVVLLWDVNSQSQSLSSSHNTVVFRKLLQAKQPLKSMLSVLYNCIYPSVLGLDFQVILRCATAADAAHKINMWMWRAVYDVLFLCDYVCMLYWPSVSAASLLDPSSSTNGESTKTRRTCLLDTEMGTQSHYNMWLLTSYN